MSGKEEVVRPKGFRVVHLVLIAVIAAVSTVASIAASVLQPFPGLAFIYLPGGILPVFGIWFGPWALIGAIIAGVLYAPAWGMAPHFGLLSGLSDAVYALIPWIAFKVTNADPSLKNKKDYAVWFVFVVILATVVTDFTYQMLSIYVYGWYTMDMFPISYTVSVTGGLIAVIPLSFILLKVLSPYVKKSSLYVKGWIY